ncbi:YHS domain-containing (seleno)protein, partial [Pseudoalteromonas denitrificans]
MNKLIYTLFLIFSLSAFSGEFYTSKRGVMGGYDPVSYFKQKRGSKGSAKITYQWAGATWRFKSEENRSLFIASPRTYAPQFGSYCAMAMAHNENVISNPKISTIFEDKLYLFYTKDAYRSWKANKK